MTDVLIYTIIWHKHWRFVKHAKYRNILWHLFKWYWYFGLSLFFCSCLSLAISAGAAVCKEAGSDTRPAYTAVCPPSSSAPQCSSSLTAPGTRSTRSSWLHGSNYKFIISEMSFMAWIQGATHLYIFQHTFKTSSTLKWILNLKSILSPKVSFILVSPYFTTVAVWQLLSQEQTNSTCDCLLGPIALNKASFQANWPSFSPFLSSSPFAIVIHRTTFQTRVQLIKVNHEDQINHLVKVKRNTVGEEKLQWPAGSCREKKPYNLHALPSLLHIWPRIYFCLRKENRNTVEWDSSHIWHSQ